MKDHEGIYCKLIQTESVNFQRRKEANDSLAKLNMHLTVCR